MQVIYDKTLNQFCKCNDKVLCTADFNNGIYNGIIISFFIKQKTVSVLKRDLPKNPEDVLSVHMITKEAQLLLSLWMITTIGMTTKNFLITQKISIKLYQELKIYQSIVSEQTEKKLYAQHNLMFHILTI